MSYQVFARKYRPKTFADVLGQDHVVRTLRNAIAQKRLAHAYLFVGPRGTGKTSTARIFAKALNCPGGPKIEFDPDDPVCREIAEGTSLDVLEIDGASNNGVEQVRELRETVKYAPSSGRFKIYYIDEVHMLTTAAFNALLKTLEEPPEHVKFIFATTEPNKILPTIISRCQRFDLRRIPAPLIAEHLLHIAKLEGVDLDEKAAFAIGKGAEGGMRDAQSMMDQLVAFCGNRIEEANVLEIFGFTAAETVAELAGCLLSNDTVGALRVVHDQSESGKDLGRLLADLIQHVRTLLVYQADPEAALEDASPEVAKKVAEQAGLGSARQLLRVVDGLAEVDARMRWATNKRLHFELGIIQAVQHFNEVSLDDVIQALDQGGTAALARPAPVRPLETQARRAATSPSAAAAPSVTSPVTSPPREPEAPPPSVEATPRPRLRDLIEQTELPAAPAKPATPPVQAAAVPAPAAAELDPATFWPQFLTEVSQRRPLTLHWVKVATLLGLTPGRLTLGFPKSEEAARDSLMRESARTFLEQVAGDLMGVACKLEMVLDDSLSVPDLSALNLDFGGQEPPATAALDANRDNLKAAPAQAPAPATNGLADDFYNDPLIQQAVARFKLTLIDSSAP